MRAFVVASGVRVAPFGDLARDLPVANEPLHALQARLLEKFGLEPVWVNDPSEIPQGEDRVVLYDYVWLTRRVLKSFLSRWRKGGRAASRLALPLDSTFVRTFSTLADHQAEGEHALYDVWALPAGTAFGADTAPLQVVYSERVIELPVPRYVTGIEKWIHPITTSVVIHVKHWVNLLDANRLSIQVAWVDEIVARPWGGIWIGLRALWPGRGRLLWRALGAANRFGKNVDIHPTARVEGSFVGDGVTIGAQALVRGAIIGAGAVIEDRANVAYSVIGPGSFVSKHTLIYTSACLEDANVGMSMQMCLAGRRAALTPRATPIDVIPGARVKVKDGDRYVEVDYAVLGSCYGHDTFIGADVYVAPGRAIPNGTRIGPRPERVLASLPDEIEPGRVYVVKDGRLEEL